ncbi:hypothetical protein ACGYLO_16430 [Sulfitobacter sp. 1A13353]|uniref:hypothetical protein n=1 Tax=Sulfitobacter sp. 1A13353 TaxID=3368568 RepID=UPI0037452657
MTDYTSGPWAHPPRKRQERQPTFGFAMAVIIGLGIAVLLHHIDARSEHARWEATFAPCTTARC